MSPSAHPLLFRFVDDYDVMLTTDTRVRSVEGMAMGEDESF